MNQSVLPITSSAAILKLSLFTAARKLLGHAEAIDAIPGIHRVIDDFNSFACIQSVSMI